jgi:hypothetical protein
MTYNFASSRNGGHRAARLAHRNVCFVINHYILNIISMLDYMLLLVSLKDVAKLCIEV